MNPRSNELLYNHFRNKPCKEHGYKVQIIEKISDPESKDKEKLDENDLLRRSAEERWMEKLGTIFPYGLNDRYKGRDFRDKPEDEYIFRKHYPKLEHLPSKHFHKKQRAKKISKSQMTEEEILLDIQNKCKCYGTEEIACAYCTLNYARIKIQSLKKSTAKKLGTFIAELLYNNRLQSRMTMMYYNVFIDLINSKFAPYNTQKSKNKRIAPELICKIQFSSKVMQDINLNRIFRDKRVTKSLPSIIPQTLPTVVYKYNKPIRNKILNYKDVIENLDIEEFISNYNDDQCECKNSEFTDKNHGHILTGNLNIVEDEDLKNLLKQGPKYREQPGQNNFTSLNRNLRKQIKVFINSWSQKTGIPLEAFGEWQTTVFEMINNRLKFLKKIPKVIPKEVLKNPSSSECLKSLHERFVLTSVDKAAHNIAIICKKYYIKVVLSEIGLWPGTKNTTYDIIENKPKKVIVYKQFNFNSEYSIKDNEPTSSLPFIYCIPKFHKNPVKFRFIISSSNCQTKPLAKTISLGLKLCQQQHKVYCQVLRSYTGVNNYFIIDNNKPLLDCLTNLNIQNKARSLETFDFSTLYTKISHDTLLENLRWFVEIAFNGALRRGRNFMAVYKNEAKWITKPRLGTTTVFTKTSFSKCVEFLIRNAYFEIGDRVMQQIIGIPMGTDPGPFMANAHLYKYEFDFQTNMRKNNYKVARSLNNTFRYIDDISPINDKGNFIKYKSEIYPKELELSKENLGTTEATILDLNIKIENDKFNIGIYDKTDNYNFEVVKYPSIHSNIQDSLLYNVFYSQMLRFFNICNSKIAFLDSSKQLLNRCLYKGAERNKLMEKIKILNKKYNLSRIDLSLDELLNHLSIT